MVSRKSLIPARVRAKLPPPDRARERKITVRFTTGDFDLLTRMSAERSERVSAFVRNLVLATLDDLKGTSR